MSVPQQKPAAPPRRVDADTWTMLGLAVAVLWMYLPPSLLTGKVLYGYDAFILHVRRLEFARQYLFASSPSLPAWYPREFLGTPFWSNLQNFPLIPTRLPLLLVDPWSAHGVGTNIAAVLAALFTYLLARRLGLGRTGAAVAGWTFACCGYFASRVMAGHLPLLEAYPALPLLLWLIERYAASDSPRTLRLNLLALGLSTGFVMLAGHPQLPIYAVGTAFLYLVIRAFGRKALVGAVAMIAGVGCMSFVLYPMFRLVGRSTRVLKLGPPSNDVYFPFERLKAFVLPWKDAQPETYAYWDTGCYVGLLPLAAAAFVAIRWAVTRRRPGGVWLFLAVLGALALLLAFPRPWSTGGGLTILRSPARQLYLTVFALALAGGVSIDLLLRLRERLSGRAALLAGAAAVFLVAAHAVDIRLNIGPFVEAIDAPDDLGVAPALAQAVGDGRIAMDCEEVDPNNRRLDDVGVYDSILLAKPYRAMLALSGMPAETNMQFISGPDLSPRALAWGGTRMVVTRRKDLSLPVVTRGEFLNVYTVSNALPRAGFIPSTSVVRADEESVLWDFRAGAAPSPGRIFLPPDQSQPATVPATLPVPAATSVVYRRPHPDRIEVDVTAPADGYVRILETFDAGWSATVDGAPAEIVLADTFVSAVRVSPGFHELRLTYHTPGVGTGIGLTIAAAAALAALIASAPRLLRPQSWQ